MSLNCSYCKQEKDISEFRKTKHGKNSIHTFCKECENIIAKKYYYNNKDNINNKQKNKYIKYPWKRTYYNIQQRCNNSNVKQYKNYGGRGIECRITEDELKFLWKRDNASEMKKPSIDRKDNDGHYELSNCRFIELKENAGKTRRVKTIQQYDLDGNFIQDFNHAKEAYRILGIRHINDVINNKRKTAGGFIWRIK